MVSLLETLSQETNLLSEAGNLGLEELIKESDSLLDDLEKLEASLVKEVEDGIEKPSKLAFPPVRVDSWYKLTISNLKVYNNGIGKFTKAILSNSNFNKNMDDAYLYKLVISDTLAKSDIHTDDTHCKREGHDPHYEARKLENHEQLRRAIYLHLLKTGHSDLVRHLIDDLEETSLSGIEEAVLPKFEFIKKVSEDIRERHDLTLALSWFREKHALSKNSPNDPIDDDLEFKLHALQFVLLLGDKTSSVEPLNMSNLLEAYAYSKNNFNRFFRDYLDAIRPLTTLLLRRYESLNSETTGHNATNRHVLYPDLQKVIDGEARLADNIRGTDFVQNILDNFDAIHNNQPLFEELVDEFTKVFCKDMNLSSESSLLQSILAGFVFMPSFHKYTSIERRLSAARGRASAETGIPGTKALVVKTNDDLPFQLPDAPRFLFHHHPIFTCPISKEQLAPMDQVKLGQGEKSEDHQLTGSPLVVLNLCQHVALRESIWHLSKKGVEVFKCHYCYKKHKYLDVTNAYLIDY